MYALGCFFWGAPIAMCLTQGSAWPLMAMLALAFGPPLLVAVLIALSSRDGQR
jgi:hypothetical protein